MKSVCERNEEPERKSILGKFNSILTDVKKRLLGIPHVGFLMALSSAGFYALSGVTLKLVLESGFSVRMSNVFYTTSAMITLFVVFASQRFTTNVGKKDVLPLMLFSACSTISLICLIYAFKFTEVVYATALFNTQIIFASMLSCFFLKETINMFDGFIIALLLSASVLVTNPLEINAIINNNQKQDRSAIDHVIGCLFGIGVGLSMSVCTLLNRKLSYANPVFMAWLIFISYFLFSMSYVGFSIKLPESTYQWVWLVVSGFFIAAANILRSLAAQIENITYVSLAMSLETPFVLVLQWAFLKELPGLCEAFGIGIASFSIVLWTLKEIIIKNNPCRGRYSSKASKTPVLISFINLRTNEL